VQCAGCRRPHCPAMLVPGSAARGAGWRRAPGTTRSGLVKCGASATCLGGTLTGTKNLFCKEGHAILDRSRTRPSHIIPVECGSCLRWPALVVKVRAPVEANEVLGLCEQRRVKAGQVLGTRSDPAQPPVELAS
jgi:hypothetical protein